MSLKDQIADDIGAVFLNLTEFATTHIINGVEVDAVIDNDMLREGGGNPGVYLGMKRVFIDADNFPHRFAIGSRITIDGKAYLVRDNGEEMGMYVVTIEANKT